MAGFKLFYLSSFIFFASFIHTEHLSLPGCPRKCGNITIPFPFGMNSECCFHDSFHIFCNTSFNPPKPFLGNAQVLGISLNGKMKILNSSSKFAKVGKGEGKNLLPVMAYWVAGNTSCHVARNGAASRYACQSPRSQCRGSTLGRGHICRCSPGFRGNPYLAHGCQDIDECAESNPCEGVCINTEGSYKCYCPQGTVGDGRKDGTGCHIIQEDKRILTSSSFYLPIGIFFVVPVLATKWIVWTDRKKKLQKLREDEFEKNGGNLLLSRRRSTQLALYTDQHVESITNKYNSKYLKLSCCYGGFYHGTLLNNGNGTSTDVVVMVMRKKVPQSQLKQFVDQLIFLSQPQNKNVVRILGCCLGTHSPLIVYELLNGDGVHTLSECTRGKARFSCEMRVKAATGVARGLAYLNSHKYSKNIFVHGSICSANILMDASYNAKIFYAAGSNLIRLSDSEENCVYRDPEFASSGRLNKKSDVYSFGVVLVELLTGGKTLSPNRRGNDRNMAFNFVYLFKADRLSEILDEEMSGEEDGEVVREMATLAEKCLNVKPSKRPNMKEVEAKLSKLMYIVNEFLT